jgi:hypothetical protein
MGSDWSAYIVQTTTGQVEAELPMTAAPTFDMGINATGGGSVQVMMGGNGVDKAILDPITAPWKYSVAITWRNTLVQAGPIPDETFQDSGQATQIPFGGLWSMFTKRLVFPPSWGSGNAATTAADVTYSNMTLRQIAKQLVVDTTNRPNGYLPMTFDPDDAPGTNTRTYHGYELKKLSDMLTELSGVDGGPEIDIRPQWASPGWVQWYMRTGSPRLGQLGSPWVWDYGSQGACRHLDFNRNGTNVAGNWYSKGAGDTYATVIGSAADSMLVNDGFPLLEDVDGNHTDVVEANTANGWATAMMNTYHWPTHTFTATVQVGGLDKSYRVTGSPRLDQIALGDTAQFQVKDHRRILDGTYTMRIIGVSSNDLDSVKLILQPTTYL